MNKRQIVARGFLVTCRDAAVMLDPVDEPLHEVSALVTTLAEFAGLLAIAARGDHGLSTALADRLHQLVGVIGFVCNHSFGLMLRQQLFSAGNIMLFARAEAQFQRLSLGIYREMQLRAEPAARAPEGFSVRLFLGAAPAAC